ncbi:hypothetical protein [Lacrimispora sp.]|uniref:hypothetical protein n=1 Tax=Lacrimispora sp. TaxID=2719234 RepID=UPI0028AE53E8|nr:hypothetical protein [Lacrimispora sp.]
MNKTLNNPYNFNQKNEFFLYINIGKKTSIYKNYTMWHDYVYQKYSMYKSSPKNLTNFKHYLLQKKTLLTASSSIYTNSTIPLISIIISIMMTFIFSLVSVINNYNNDLFTTLDKDYMLQLGYDLDMIISSMDQTFMSSIQFHIVGTFLSLIIGICFFLIVQDKIQAIYLKTTFLSDYIDIIEKLLDETTYSDTI